MENLKELVNLLSHKNTPEWVVSQTLRNLCYSSQNDINYQNVAIGDLGRDAEEAIKEDNEYKLLKLQEQTMFREEQLEVFEEVHALAKAAFKEVTGSEWKPASKKSLTNKNKTATREFWKKRNVG